MANDWRNGVTSHGSDGSIYQADLYCDGCTEDIKTELKRDHKAPDKDDDENSFDSDDYPKVADLDSEESDSPQHCGAGDDCVRAIKLPSGNKIGAWLGGSLTGEGLENVSDMIWTNLVSASDHKREVGRLWRHLYKDQLSEVKDPKEAVPRGFKVDWKNFRTKRIFVDLDSVYAVGQDDDSGTVKVLRYEADPKGVFPKKPEVATTDVALWDRKDPEEVLKEVIEEEGWS
jgi:hypothetical protein